MNRQQNHYQGSLKVSFNHPCFELLATILFIRTMISENVGRTKASGSQHSSINLEIQYIEQKSRGNTSIGLTARQI